MRNIFSLPSKAGAIPQGPHKFIIHVIGFSDLVDLWVTKIKSP